MKSLIPLLFLGGSLLLFVFISFFDGKKVDQDVQSASSTEKNEDYQKRVNKHLKSTSQQIELERAQWELQLQKQLPKPGENIFPVKTKNEAPFEVDSQDEAQRRLNEPFIKSKKDRSYLPSEKVLGDRATLEENSLEEERARQEYIREFRLNAWRGGYWIEVTDEGEVTRVRPLKPNEKNLPFPE